MEELKNCGRCDWWQRNYRIDTEKVSTGSFHCEYKKTQTPLRSGTCRKSRPCLVLESKDVSADFERYSTVVANSKTLWPGTAENDWCGEFK